MLVIEVSHRSCSETRRERVDGEISRGEEKEG
jgi:hypothetical protein